MIRHFAKYAHTDGKYVHENIRVIRKVQMKITRYHYIYIRKPKSKQMNKNTLTITGAGENILVEFPYVASGNVK